MLGVRTAHGAADTVGRPLFYHSSNLIASLKVPLLRFSQLMAAMCMRVGHGHESGGVGGQTLTFGLGQMVTRHFVKNPKVWLFAPGSL